VKVASRDAVVETAVVVDVVVVASVGVGTCVEHLASEGCRDVLVVVELNVAVSSLSELVKTASRNAVVEATVAGDIVVVEVGESEGDGAEGKVSCCSHFAYSESKVPVESAGEL
jgi:hypothetical protein